MARGRAERASSTPSSSRSASASASASPSPVPAPTLLTQIPHEVEEAKSRDRVSFYVAAADEMLKAVLAKEAFLFDEQELEALTRFKNLGYEARYLFVRLYLRKPTWFRLSGIGYESDISDLEAACATLCQPPYPPQAGPSSRRAPDPSVIDLTIDSDDEDESSTSGKEGEVDYTFMAVNEEVLAQSSTESMLALLSLEELVAVGKLMKVSPATGTRVEWTKALLKTTNQATLSFFGRTPSIKGKERETASKGLTFGVNYDPKGNKIKASSVMVKHVLKTLGPTIRLSPSYITLFDRLSLIYHRTAYSSTSSSTTSFTASLLARFGKRHYPTYIVSRTFSIFPSRSQLCSFEAALAMERRVEDALDDTKRGKGTLEKGAEREKGWLEATEALEGVYEDWKGMCEKCDEEEKVAGKDERGLLYYRKRFHPGWPLTRVVYRVSSVYARLGNHVKEAELLRALLAQQSFLRGKRGAWYDRLALVLTRYPTPEEVDEECGKKKSRHSARRIDEALETCSRGLEDPFTHLIYKVPLQRRITRIESLRKVPKEDRRAFELILSKSDFRVIEGDRKDDPETGKKSVWSSTVDKQAEVGVEALALEHYAREGWKGFHSENSVMTTIFALIFWDVLFAPVDGVFETAYQAAPLDLPTDAFAIVRKDMVAARLASIKEGQAANHLSTTDDRERPLNTWCVGVDWGYTKQELLEIVQCMGGHSLAIVLKNFVEEYGHRAGGLPDLCLWNPGKGTFMFSEVKGPGDRLSGTQQVWIDVLLAAGITVEVAHVMTPENRRQMIKKAQGRKQKRKRKSGQALREKNDADEDL